MVNAQKWLDKNYPQQGVCKRETDDKGWNGIQGWNNKGKKREQITKLDIRGKGLEGSLDLTDFVNLTELYCGDGNQLTSLDLSNNQQLEKLYTRGNNFSSNLSFLIHLVNLKELSLERNHFTGSLKPLRNLNKLERLNIANTDISHGLEYLPESVKIFDCSFTGEYKVSDIWEELQGFEKIEVEVNYLEKYDDEGLKKWREVKMDKELTLLTSPLLPPQLINQIKPENKVWENQGVPNTDYEKIVYFNSWKKISKNKSPLEKKDLPIKLYNVETKQAEEVKNDSSIKDYAILSYVWGDPTRKISEKMKEKIEWKKGLTTILGNKALYKAVEACKCKDLGINHLWIDQLCINQKDNAEKAQEVNKMRQYYTNATITLISLNTELGDLSNIDLIDILKLIVNSEWFTRSWTYQEGWLSKQTIFMFDDKLIDGRAMAGTWALNQLGYANEGRYLSRREFEKGTKKIATPVGWTYYLDGYNENDKVEMRLYQVLKEVKRRGRSVPIDGIYSILGLLPYGKHVKVDYNSTPQDALYEVMRVAMGYREKIKPKNYALKKGIFGEEVEAIKNTLPDGRKVIEYQEKNGYGEPLAWHGASNTTPSLCWMPQIDKNGSTSVEGGIDIRFNEMVIINPFIERKGLELRSTNYTIHKVNPTIQKLEGGFEIEGGLYKKDVGVKLKGEIVEISLFGTKATLGLVQENKCLVVPDKDEWISKKSFALLAEDTGEKCRDKYHRLGLVELGDEERLRGGNYNRQIIIGSNLQEQSSLQAQIEIPPK